MTAIRAAAEAESEMIIFGAGILASYDWWLDWDRDWSYADEFPNHAPSGWKWTVRVENPTDEDGEPIAREIGHSDLMAAARKIVGKQVAAGDGLRTQCRHMLFVVDEVDIDAVHADSILQVAVLGEIVYG